MGFLQLVWANLLGRPVRSLLTVSGVAVAVGAVAALVGISSGLERSLRDAYEGRGVDIIVLQRGKLQQTSSVLPEEIGEKIAALPGVASCTPGLTDVVALDDNDLLGVPLQGWPLGSHLLEQFNVVSGNPLSEAGKRQVLLGSALAESTKRAPGEKIELLDGESYTITGIFDSANIFENGAVVMPLKDLQKLMLREEEVTAFTIVADRHDREFVEALQPKIEQVASGLKASLARDFASNSAETRIARSFAWLTSTVAIIIGAVGVLNTMLMAVYERTAELAMMRAVGWRRRSVQTLVMAEAMLLAIFGAAVGIGGAMGLLSVLSRASSAGKMIATDISPGVLAQSLTVALVLGLIGGLYPAYRAAKLNPIDGLRHD